MEYEDVMAWTRLWNDNSSNEGSLSVSGGGGAGGDGPWHIYSGSDCTALPIGNAWAANIVQTGIPWVDEPEEPPEWRCAYCCSVVAYKPADDGKISCPHCSAPKEE